MRAITVTEHSPNEEQTYTYPVYLVEDDFMPIVTALEYVRTLHPGKKVGWVGAEHVLRISQVPAPALQHKQA